MSFMRGQLRKLGLTGILRILKMARIRGKNMRFVILIQLRSCRARGKQRMVVTHRMAVDTSILRMPRMLRIKRQQRDC